MQKKRPEERFFSSEYRVVSSECRVRQLVAMVHTTPLNGQAPNAVYGRSDAPRCSFRSKAKVNCFLHALRSDYRYTSSPPEMERDSKDY